MTSSKVIKYIRDAWSILGVTLFLLVLIESIFFIAFLARDHFLLQDSQIADKLLESEEYRNASWREEYAKELEEIESLKWEPYVYWRRKPHKGKHINIDADGIRLTNNAQQSHGKEARLLRVFMFGGSTMWGAGARDSFTIPSILAKLLDGQGLSVEIINFGQTGYVSTQGFVTLLLQLRRGNIPDVVVFYEGVNDTYSAYQNGVAGIPQNEINRVKEFNLLAPRRLRDVTTIFIDDILDNLSIVRFTKGLMSRLDLLRETKPLPARSTLDVGGEYLAQQVVDVYMGNMAVVKGLAQSFKFRCLFYWQPTIFQKNELSDHERHVYDARRDQDIKDFYTKVYSAMRNAHHDNTFHDISGIFSDVREPVYTDWFHLTERGNDRIAQTMANDLLHLLRGS
jgi:lysophospholipase L1-like esterase